MLLKQRQEVWQRLQQHGTGNCAISEITSAELLYGAECSLRPEYNRGLVWELTSQFRQIPISAVVPRYAREKNLLRQAGQLVDDFDILIAATALEYKLVMVTNNTRHFNRFSGLQLEDWAQQP